MDEHTKEPWHTGGNGTIIYDSEGWGVANATVFHGRHNGPEEAKENARRIVACVNACTGISTERLEFTVNNLHGIVKASESLSELRGQRDQLSAVCAEAYQLAGALGAPVEALDNLSAAANGEPLPHASFLPVAVPNVVAQRDQLLEALKELLSGQTIEGLRGQTGMMDICVTGEDVRAGLEAIAAVEQSAAAPAADADGWIEWNGGECPVPEGTLVNVRFANGEDQDAFVPAEEWCWSHGDCGGYDIVAYRVVQGGAS